jgi:glycosyltransferase involved in cell wall biosynthesis
MFEALFYTPVSPLRRLFHRLPYSWQLKLILLFWEGYYRWRRRSWHWAGSYLSGVSPNLGVGQPGLVSVILPVYNQAKTMVESINSVLQQSYPQLELIIVNDGSTDNTSRVLEAYAHHPHLTLINQPHQHLPTALNCGFQAARGEFLTWTSADNLMHPRQVECLVNYLQAHTNVALVYADFELIDDEGCFIEDAAAVMMRGQPHTPIVRTKHEPERLNIGCECVIGPCFMYRSFLRLLIGNYNPNLTGSEDYDYWIRIHNFFKVNHLDDDQPLYRYRLHSQRISTHLKPRISRLRRWLMQREQLFQRQLTYPLLIAVDEVSAHLLAGVEPDQNALPRLNFTRLSPDSLVDSSCQAVLVHSSSSQSDLIAWAKLTGRPFICWLNDDDNLHPSTPQPDLILTLGHTNLDSDISLLASTPKDIYHLLRIFIATRMDLDFAPPDL